jgi:hypothetical protein
MSQGEIVQKIFKFTSLWFPFLWDLSPLNHGCLDSSELQIFSPSPDSLPNALGCHFLFGLGAIICESVKALKRESNHKCQVQFNAIHVSWGSWTLMPGSSIYFLMLWKNYFASFFLPLNLTQRFLCKRVFYTRNTIIAKSRSFSYFYWLL